MLQKNFASDKFDTRES